MIIVDGCKSDKQISNFANLEEILTTVMEDKQMESRVVTDVLVNNETFSEIYPHQAEDISTDSISSVEVRSVSSLQMAQDMSAEMEKVARLMGNGAQGVARLLRNADNREAFELLQDLIDVTRDFMSMISVLRSGYVSNDQSGFVAKSDKLAELLGEITDVLDNEDWILLADLLEFEFKPICEEWRSVCQKIHQEIVAAVAQ